MSNLYTIGKFSTILCSIAIFSRCVGPDLGSVPDKNKKISAGSNSDCSYCLQLPQITAPADQAVIDNTTGKITIAPIVSEACEYTFSGAVNFSSMRKKSAEVITEFVPTTAWPLGQAINVSVRCFDNEDTANAQVTASASSAFSVALVKPAVINPFGAYITTSNLVRVKSTAHAAAAIYEWEITQSSAAVLSSSSVVAETVVEIPFPSGVYGSFEIKTRYRDANGIYSEYSDAVTFNVRDRALGTTAYQQDFTIMARCGDKTTMLIAGCSGVTIFGTYPTCDSTNWYGGGGNVWICNTGFEGTNVLQTNQAAFNHISFYSAVYQNIDVTNASFEIEAHQQGNAEDPAATVISCRAYPVSGNDGFSFVIYPYRTSGVNVEIRNRRFATNSFDAIGSAYRTEAQLLSGPSRNWLRFDCLDTYFTGYYKNTAGKWYPLVVAESSFIAGSPHRIGMSLGQGNQWIKLRVYSINVKNLL